MTSEEPKQASVVETPDDDEMIDRGSGNFLADQGIEDTDEFRVKAHLCHEIAATIEGAGLTQDQAAKLVGLAQSDVSRIVNSRFDDYSVWKLLKVMTSLGSDVLISISPPTLEGTGVVMSHTAESLEEETSRGRPPSAS